MLAEPTGGKGSFEDARILAPALTELAQQQRGGSLHLSLRVQRTFIELFLLHRF
jgi:hypothetical protein